MEFFKEIEDLKEEVKNLKRLLQRIVCPAEVVEVDEKLHRVRVKLLDRQGMITGFLPVLVPAAKEFQVCSLPQVGDNVLVLFLPQGPEDGFVLGSFYHEQKPPPRKDHKKWFVHVPGEIEIVSDTHIVLKAPRIDLNP